MGDALADQTPWLYQVDWSGLRHSAAATVAFFSDLITCVVGGASIYAFFRYRHRVSALLRLLRVHYLNDRISEIKKTLERLESTTITKGGSPESRALFGRLSGQLGPLCSLIPALKPIHDQVDDIALNKGPLTEPIRNKVTYRIEAEIANARLTDITEAVEE